MPLFLIKSFLSLVMLILALFAMFTMFEVLGRTEKRFNVTRLMSLHRINGKIYFVLFLIISYFCLDFILQTKGELSSRATFHMIFALTIIVLLVLKVFFVRVYRQFYGLVKTLGILIALMTFGMVGTSGGYYLLVTKFGTDVVLKKSIEEKKEVTKKAIITVRTDQESIRKGKELYDSKCFSCHDPESTNTIIGPGHKGILKNPTLPVSKKPATLENIMNQLRTPFKDMPSFSYLSDEELQNIIAYLNTL